MAANSLGRHSRVFVEVRKAIEDYIIEHSLKPGDQLPTEPEFCELFGVSRTAVREAMKLLEVFGVVSIEPGRGTFLKKPNAADMLSGLPLSLMLRQEDFREVTEVRRILERYCMEKAANCVTVFREELTVIRMVDNLGECVREMERKAHDGETLIEEDIAFHRILAEFADNSVLLMILELFWNLRSRFPQDNSKEALQIRYHRHQRLYDAINSGNMSALDEAFEEHYTGSIEETSLMDI
ncbi:MAG: FadR/GntR family transcriptional regulator [Limnochordia bacterium]|jgi:GntR family transcriptional repressor for pyruvate dehydrogenase complex|nr:FadR family transcriptional regulator [Limnochordia bacterium]MDD2629132.1 FadR/GntR family transcriptional regulator [Limnochordia bacterium]MDD4518537.1 FadR/GntR family transcriptional regulator [Limnochordia bacterium]